MTMLMESTKTVERGDGPGIRTSLDMSIVELESSVRGVNYPAKKWDLVIQAKDNRATNDVLTFLHLLPEGRYCHFNDIACMAWSFLLV